MDGKPFKVNDVIIYSKEVGKTSQSTYAKVLQFTPEGLEVQDYMSLDQMKQLELKLEPN